MDQRLFVVVAETCRSCLSTHHTRYLEPQFRPPH